MCRLYSVCGIDRVWIYRNDVYHNAHNTIVYSRSSLLHSNISMHRLCSEACSCEACIAKAVLLTSTVATAILVSAQFESGCLNNRSVPPLVSFWIPIWNFSLNFLSCSRPDARHLEWCRAPPVACAPPVEKACPRQQRQLLEFEGFLMFSNNA